MPSIPASSTRTIYIYYGNAAATSQSNGDLTFDFFDDFNAVNPAKWIYESGKTSITGGVLQITGTTSCDLVLISQSIFGYTKGTIGIAVDWRSRYVGEIANSGWDVFIPHQNVAVDDCGGTSGNYFLFANFVNRLHRHTGTTWTPVVTGSGADVSGAWRVFSGVIDQNFNIRLLQDYSTQIFSYSEPTFTTLSGYLAYREGNHWIDWVRIRKYTSPEPTISVGPEETPSPPSPQTVFYIQNGTGNAVSNADVYVRSTGRGIILKDANGNCWRVTVSTTGALQTAPITCP